MIELKIHDILRYSWIRFVDDTDIFSITAKDKIFYTAPTDIYSAVVRDLFFETSLHLHRYKLGMVEGVGDDLISTLKDTSITKTAGLAMAAVYCLMNLGVAKSVVRADELLKEVLSIYDALGDYRYIFDRRTGFVVPILSKKGRDARDSLNMLRLGIAIRSLVLANMLKETLWEKLSMDLGVLALELLNSLVNSPTPRVRDLFRHYTFEIRFKDENKRRLYAHTYILKLATQLG
ncbi:MAG: hypothetical protein QXI64_10750 [Sulfolobales archaeon]